MPRRLHGVGVEQHARLAADFADLGDRQNGADLVVGVHDGHETGVRAKGALHLLRRDRADGADGQKLDLESLFFKLFQRVQHGVMLESRRNDVLFALARAKTRGRENCLIVGLAAAGGEVDLARRGVQARCDALARILQRLGRLLPDGMQARGVAVDRFHIGQHRVDGRAAHLRGGSVVCVNSCHRYRSFAMDNSYLSSMFI